MASEQSMTLESMSFTKDSLIEVRRKATVDKSFTMEMTKEQSTKVYGEVENSTETASTFGETLTGSLETLIKDSSKGLA